MRMGAEYPTCVPMKPASIRSLEFVIGTTMWTVPHLLTGKISSEQLCASKVLRFRYFLNDLTYRTDPPKSSTESYNVRRKKSKWSVKEPKAETSFGDKLKTNAKENENFSDLFEDSLDISDLAF